MQAGYNMQATTCTCVRTLCIKFILRNCNPEPKLWLRTPNKRRGKAAIQCMVMILKCYRLHSGNPVDTMSYFFLGIHKLWQYLKDFPSVLCD